MSQLIALPSEPSAEHASSHDSVADKSALPRCRVAYVMSRFPKLTETFVLFEMLAVEQQSAQVGVYPLLGGFSSGKEVAGAGLGRKLLDHFRAPSQPGLMHPEAASFVARARYVPFVNVAIGLANLIMLLRHPIRYVETLAKVIAGNRGNANFLWGGISVFPKCVYFARCMRRDGTDHIHAHFANHPATAAYIIHRFTGLPYSFTAHGSDLHRHKTMLREKVEDAAFVVAISAYNRTAIIDHCGPRCASKVHTIHCGVDVDRFRPAPRLSHNPKTLQVICVGTLHEVKGQIYLLHALRRLRDQGMQCHVHLVGDGEDFAMLEDLTRKESLQSDVTFHGTKTRPQLIRLLQASDLLVAPSVPTHDGRREGIPVVLMEAMACGLPVVASRISGIPELIDSDEVGRLVPPRDVAGLAGAIQEFATDPGLRKRLGCRARERIVAHFSLHKNSEALIALFEGSSDGRGLEKSPCEEGDL
jgi:colanic acid/amylovoran biosynthesis glycosyltransferase